MGFIEFLIDSLTDFGKRLTYLILGIILFLLGIKLLFSGSLSYFLVGFIVLFIGAAIIGYSKRGLPSGQPYIQGGRNDMHNSFDDGMDRAEWEMDRAEREMDRADRLMR